MQDAINTCTLLSSSINRISSRALDGTDSFFPFTRSRQRQWLVGDHSYHGCYYYCSFCLACISPLQLIRPHATQDSLRSKRTKGRKRTRVASALHPSTRRAIHPYPSRSSDDSSEPLPRGTLCGRFSSQLMVSAPSPLGPIHARGEACACRSLASFFPVALHQPHAAAACVHRACRLLAVSCSCKLTS